MSNEVIKSEDNQLEVRKLEDLKRPNLEWGIRKNDLTPLEQQAVTAWITCQGVPELLETAYEGKKLDKIKTLIFNNEFVSHVINHLSERGECPSLTVSKEEKRIMLAMTMRSSTASAFQKSDALKEDNKMAGHYDDKSGANGVALQISICTGVPDSDNEYWQNNN
ncbi:hypothetical protein AAEX28_04665 [Lentisphaerota bacterium WC36G]|nr:hypothetical protein LJT99_07525 [Lentisphaerae bacterium WC36]